MLVYRDHIYMNFIDVWFQGECRVQYAFLIFLVPNEHYVYKSENRRIKI